MPTRPTPEVGPGNRERYDVAILGAGPAGSATALALRRRLPARVLLVEASRFDGERVGESLAPGSSALFRQLGVLDAFRAEGHDSCPGNCSAWGSDELGYSDFVLGVHGPGWHLDRTRFDAFLARQAADAGAVLATGLRFLAADRVENGFRLRLRGDGGETTEIEARFVVDATGPVARFARAQGALRRTDDRLLCLTDLWERTTGDVSHLTLLEAAEHGWWYTARLPRNRLVTMLATDRAGAASQGLADPARRHAALAVTRHVGPRLAECGARWLEAIPRAAPSFLLDPVEGDRWLAAGDAACAFDPISAGGIHKALRDGLDAAAWLEAALEGRPAAGTYAAKVEERYRGFLRNRRYFYEQERRWPDTGFWVRRRQAQPPARSSFSILAR